MIVNEILVSYCVTQSVTMFILNFFPIQSFPWSCRWKVVNQAKMFYSVHLKLKNI